jgi:hypothetical protein
MHPFILRDRVCLVCVANSSSLLELLTLQSPDVTLYAWKIEDDISNMKLRDIMITVRQEVLTKIVVMTSAYLSLRLLKQVSIY